MDPVVQDPQATQDPKVEIPKEDLITRVSQVKPEEKGVAPLDQEVQNLATKEDVVAWAKKKESEWSSGYGKKFQDLAEERKSWEAKRAEGETWTKERVQSLLNDPSFVSAAQSITPQADDGSILSDTEKKRISDAESIANQALQQNAQLLMRQQDENNKAKYANYDSGAIDIITSDMLNKRYNATREDIWKVVDYNDAVKRAYALGLRDKNETNVEKINSMSTPGKVVVGDESVPNIEEKETSKNYFLRLANRRFQQSQESGQVRK